MRNITLCLAATLALGACAHVTTNPSTGKTDVDVESPTKQGEDWKATVRGMAGFAQLSGEAKATVVAGSSATTVTLTLTGGQAAASHPWMVHEGSCQTPGNPVGSAADYPALTFGSDGKATATANLPAQLNEATDYVVVVHASASDMTMIACGNLDD